MKVKAEVLQTTPVLGSTIDVMEGEGSKQPSASRNVDPAKTILHILCYPLIRDIFIYIYNI